MRRAPRFVRNASLALGWALCSTASAQTERTEAPSGAQTDADAARNADAPAPDYAGALRADVQLHAWFNAARTRAVLRVGDYTSRLYPAWKVVLADLDGDGANEVVLGAWSWTRRHDEPDPHRAVWVLAWDAQRQELREVWRGSALARPLLDFELRAGHLFALERSNGVCFRTRYQWTGFGFAARGVAREECKQ